MQYKEEYLEKLKKYDYVLKELHEIIINKTPTTRVYGDCFYVWDGVSANEDILENKRINLYTLGKFSKNILEIGFNVGHSTILFLIANPNSKIIVIDICKYDISIKCFEYLNKEFPNRLTLLKGDSLKVLPEMVNERVIESINKCMYLDKFDLIHIDGGHENNVVKEDLNNSIILSCGYIIVDDTQMSHINDIFNVYSETGVLHEVKLHDTKKYTHRIGITNNIHKKIIKLDKNIQCQFLSNKKLKYIAEEAEESEESEEFKEGTYEFENLHKVLCFDENKKQKYFINFNKNYECYQCYGLQ